MTKNTHVSTVFASRKRRTYSAEFKNSIVQACKAPNTSIASVALQYGLNANLVCKWIRLLDGGQALHNSAPSKPTFIALPYSATFNPSITAMLPVHITLPDSNIEIGLKWQASEMPALAELLKALATLSVSMKSGSLPSRWTCVQVWIVMTKTNLLHVACNDKQGLTGSEIKICSVYSSFNNSVSYRL